jgi:hypothetical protein
MKSVSSQDTSPYGLAFSSDGTKMYVTGNTNDTVYQYSLSTAWDVSTASFGLISPMMVTSNNKSFGSALSFDGLGGSWKLQDDLVLGMTNTLTLTNGSFDDNGKNVSVGLFSSSNSNARLLTKGSGTWSLTGAGAVWDTSATANFALVDSGTIKLVNNSAIAKTFAGGGLTFHSYWNATQGTGTATISGSNRFDSFRSDAGRINLFTAGTTQTIEIFSANGSAGNLTVLGSTSSSPFLFTKIGDGYVSASYLSISNSTVIPTLDTWYAGITSTDGGNNSGWIFTSSGPLKKSIQGSVKFDGTFQMR